MFDRLQDAQTARSAAPRGAEEWTQLAARIRAAAMAATTMHREAERRWATAKPGDSGGAVHRGASGVEPTGRSGQLERRT